MTAFNLHIDSSKPAWAEALAASLPVSVNRLASLPADATNDLVLLEGTGEWPERLTSRISNGQRRFLLVDPMIPTQTALEAVIALVHEAKAEVTISETHGGSPAVAAFLEAMSGSYSAVTMTGCGMKPLADMVLQQIRLARGIGLGQFAVVNTLVSLNSVVATLDAELEGEKLLLRLSICRSTAVPAHHRLTAHSPTNTAVIEVASDASARPALAFRAGMDGTFGLPSQYESAHRYTLRLLASGSEGGSLEALVNWQRDAALALAIISEE